MSGGVAKRYARALFEVANERGLVDQIETELKDILGVVQADQDLNQFLMHPHIAAAAKKEFVNDAFSKQVSEETSNFLKVLVDNGREADLAGIVATYVQLSNEARGIADAVVTTAKPLSEAELAELAAQFGKTVNKTLRLQSVVDPAILGGVVVQIGDRLYDGSLKSKLEHFAHQL
ncbi:F0F1 ATP synthase subunit delta [Brevibacillus dissolubilis]|uniref:F0F1 ATP synthase subunit delta n=1 Tax=Brevibacillus dissolubilis TaxID=1844116 RepID=UPI00111715E8|nr:F0F1 ATP synthase subunit delta [Brevibacillus dissolubilis]